MRLTSATKTHREENFSTYLRLKAYFPQSDETLERQLSGVSSPDFMAAIGAQCCH